MKTGLNSKLYYQELESQTMNILVSKFESENLSPFEGKCNRSPKKGYTTVNILCK